MDGTQQRPLVIGIVGGIGSGKSLVASELVKHSGYLISGDMLGHEALRQPEIMRQVAARWGKDVFDAGGQVERKRLGAIVFADRLEREALEAITHPYIKRRIREEIATACSQPDVRLIVLDAAILLEAGWHDVCDYLLFVDSPDETRIKRLVDKRGWTAQDAAHRQMAQMPLEEKRRRADAVVMNDAGPEAVESQVSSLLARWKLL